MSLMKSLEKANAHFQAAEAAENQNDFILARKEYELAIQYGSCEAKIALAVLFLLDVNVQNSGVRAEELLNDVVSSSGTPDQALLPIL